MDNNFLKECVKFNKKKINHAFITIERYQKNREKIRKHLFYFPQAENIDLRENKLIEQWKSMCMEGQHNIKKIIHNTFDNIENLI